MSEFLNETNRMFPEVPLKYELLEEVGRGGMGVVYRARHRELNQIVAIKFQTVREGMERFQREARTLASLESPHIVGVQDFEVLGSGEAMMVMKWIDGNDLDKAIDSAQNLPEEQIRLWMSHVCDGMATAANQGVVHRDLKPANIMIDGSGKALVTDFGLARSTVPESVQLTKGIMGTPWYMAPEQAEDTHSVDTRADIYSFGATFFHLLTRRPPFTGESWFSVLLKHKTEPLTRPNSLNPEMSDLLSSCIERCLAKSPQDRFQTFDEIKHELAGDEQEDPWNRINQVELAPHVDKYGGRKPRYLDGGESVNDEYVFPNGRRLVILHGDLAEQRVDALVSSDDESLSMGGGVSDHLANRAGGEYRKMAQLLVPIRPGRVAVTPAGSLPARFVFHGVTLGLWDGQVIDPTRDIINEIMEACFYHADTVAIESIAFPLLATGAGQFPPDVCLDLMFRFLIRKLRFGLTNLREVRIVLHSRK